MSTESVLAREIHYMYPAETVTFVADFTKLLRSTETLTGTPSASLSGLTVVSKAVNTGVEEDDQGVDIAVGKGVVITITAGATVGQYLLPITCGTTLNSNSRTLVCPIVIAQS